MIIIMDDEPGYGGAMKIIRDVVCTKCGKKQVREREELLEGDLFWRLCESCRQYGLKAVTRYKLGLRDWMEILYNTLGLRVAQTEAFLIRSVVPRCLSTASPTTSTAT